MKNALLILTLLLTSTEAMAGTKTWQNGGVNNNYSTAGNWVEGSKPATGDDVVIAANYNMVIDEATAVVHSWDMTGYTGTMSGSSQINIRVISGGAKNCIIAGTITWTGTLALGARNVGDSISLTTNGKTLNSITMGASSPNDGEMYFLDNVTTASSRTLTLTNGTLHIDGAADNSGLTHSIGVFNSNNSNTRHLKMGNCTLNITNNGVNSWIVNPSAGWTLTSGTSELKFTAGTAAGMFHNGNTGGTFYDITVTGAGAKTDSFTISGNFGVSNSLTFAGNSATNRMHVTALTLGTQRTITVTGATVTGGDNYDLRDILFANGGSSLDLTVGGTKVIGDCGGNGMSGGGTLTTTTGVTQNLTMSTSKSYSDATIWSGGRAPLPQDDVTATGWTAGTLTIDMPRLGRDHDFTGASGTMTRSIAHSSYGDWKYVAGITVTTETTQTHTFQSQRRTGTITITSAGKSWIVPATFAAYNTTVSLADSFSNGSNNTTLSAGTLTTNGYSFSGQNFATSSGTTYNMGASTHSCSGSFGGNTWAPSGTVNAGTSTIVFNAATKTQNSLFVGGSKTYYNWNIYGTGSGTINVSGSNTFNKITLLNPPKTIRFTAGTTQTVADFSVNGTAGNLATLNSLTGGSAATLTKSGGGTLALDYLSITDINVTPSSTWYYGNNSTYVSGTGWNSGSPPSGQAYSMLTGVG